MWLNREKISDSEISRYQRTLLGRCPSHIVIDNLFNGTELDRVVSVLRQPHKWQTQQHTYSALYVDKATWQSTNKHQRFVQRDAWQRDTVTSAIAQDFLSFLRGDEFMSVLSRIFNVQLTDINVADPRINTNYFRLGADDFIGQHADDSPGREVCMLLYLNKNWSSKAGGELCFLGEPTSGQMNKPVAIAPLYNRCVLFNPHSTGSEHWVEKLRPEYAGQYRYNVTSWYWVE